jgi:hypothetical protein
MFFVGIWLLLLVAVGNDIGAVAGAGICYAAALGPAAPVRAEALQSYEQSPRAVSGQVIDGAGTARAMPSPRDGDGPPPGGPTDRSTIAEAGRLLTDSAEMTRTLARCIVNRRPLPSYLSLKTVEEIAERAERVGDRLTGRE